MDGKDFYSFEYMKKNHLKLADETHLAVAMSLMLLWSSCFLDRAHVFLCLPEIESLSLHNPSKDFVNSYCLACA